MTKKYIQENDEDWGEVSSKKKKKTKKRKKLEPQSSERYKMNARNISTYYDD